VKAYADKIGLVEAINQLVDEMRSIQGPLCWHDLDTLSGRSPLYRLEEFFYAPRYGPALGQAVR